MNRVLNITLIVFLGIHSGCFRANKSEDQLYMLRSETIPANLIVSDGDPLLVLSPVKVASYLDRPQMVVALSEHEFRLSESHRWADRLDVNISRVSTQNLSHLLPKMRVTNQPFSRDIRPDYQVSIVVEDMHSGPKDELIFEASWMLRTSSGKIVNRRFSCKLPVMQDDFSVVVEAESQCVYRLNKEIASAVVTH